MTITAPDPAVDIRRRYTVEHSQTTTDKEWPRSLVRVYDTLKEEGDDLVYEYKRNYSFLHTFEPFRQWQGDKWHDYALISPSYVNYEVLDLETGQVVAKRDSENHSSGFCPVDFYVPDLLTDDDGGYRAEDIADSQYKDWFKDDFATHSGQFGFVSGCVWGDDTSSKLRYIDLSKVSEGIVTEEERFGYWELPSGRLRNHIRLDGTSTTIARNFYVRLATGEISPYYKQELKFAETW